VEAHDAGNVVALHHRHVYGVTRRQRREADAQCFGALDVDGLHRIHVIDGAKRANQTVSPSAETS